ncbi:MAG: hypothetical protein FD129_3344, partial [bacterium]
ITLHEVRLESEAFALSGGVRVGLDGGLTAQTTLAVEPGVSDAIIRGVNELQSLADAEGRLTLPVTLQGRLPQVSVMPDVSYVASRLIVTKAREWLSGMLEDALGPRGAPAPETAPPTAP